MVDSVEHPIASTGDTGGCDATTTRMNPHNKPTMALGGGVHITPLLAEQASGVNKAVGCGGAPLMEQAVVTGRVKPC